MKLNVECTEKGDQIMVINQAMVDRAIVGKAEPTMEIGPGALVLGHDHRYGSNVGLTRELKFLSGIVYEGDLRYNLRVTETGRLRDGGTRLFKLELKHTKTQKYLPVKLTLGGNITTFELTYQYK